MSNFIQKLGKVLKFFTKFIFRNLRQRFSGTISIFLFIFVWILLFYTPSGFTNPFGLTHLPISSSNYFESMSFTFINPTSKLFHPEKVYYVAPYGNDRDPGTENQPWQTIQKAARVMTSGETVYIRAGNYQERIVPQNSGTDSQHYITFSAFPGESVTIDGTSIPVPEDEGLIFINNRKFIRISGLKIFNSNYAGILADKSNHIIIERISTYNTKSSGIGIWGSENIIIDSNELELACLNGMQETLTVAGADTFEVMNNYLHNSRKEGICTKDGSSNGKVFKNHIHHTRAVGIYVDAWDKHTFNIEVFQNKVHETGTDGIAVASEMGGLLENVKIYNNIVYLNTFQGINISRNGPVDVQPMKTIQCVNNTVHGNGTDSWGGGIGIGNQDAQDILIRNNICCQNLSFQIDAEDINPRGLIVDHNLVYPFYDYPGEFHGSIETDPLLIDPANADFHLHSSSPAIDQGDSEHAPVNDFEGHPRPLDGNKDNIAAYDLGVYEFSYPITEVHENKMLLLQNGCILLQNYPNPFNSFTTITYTLAESGNISLKLYDLLGREMVTIVNRKQEAGTHQIKFYSGNLASGNYFYRLNTDRFKDTRRLTVLK